MIEQESIRKHAFTRHVMASFGGDDGDDDDCGSEGRGGCDDIDADDDHDDDDDDDDLERRRAKQQFAALKQQMLHTKQEDASSAQPKSQVEAVNMEELSGGLLDESVRYWTDFQQVTCGCCARSSFRLWLTLELMSRDLIVCRAHCMSDRVAHCISTTDTTAAAISVVQARHML